MARILSEIAVSAERREIDDQLADIVEGVRALRVSRNLRLLPGIEGAVSFFKRGLRLLAKPPDLFLDRNRGVAFAKRAQLLDFAFEFRNRFFEVEIGAHGRREREVQGSRCDVCLAWPKVQG